ncbi:MAG: threonine synthase [Bacteroidota bacterium]
MAEQYHFECVDCKAAYPGDAVIYLCPACEAANKPGEPPRGVLKTIYPYDSIRSKAAPKALFEQLTGEGYLPLLPLRSMDSWPSLKVGETPLYRFDRFDVIDKMKVPGQSSSIESGVPRFECYLKDDSQNPTFSFKDRASALVSAWAREHGITTLIAASTGNAGSSLAGICASQQQQAMIVVPAAAPLAKLTQILMYGALLIPVKGTYDDAFALSVQISKKHGYYNRNTAYNPLTIEGKKTVSFEIFRQLNSKVPDRIFIPVGDGVIYAGVCKGFEDLLKLGIIDRMPELVAVQAEGSSNFIRNRHKNSFTIRPSKTIADSISVDVPQCFHMASAFMDEYHGTVVSVTDEEILQASLQLSRSTGIFSEPAAVAAFAGMLKFRSTGLIPAGSTSVVLLTGSGLKDLRAVQSSIRIPEPIEPNVASAEKLI